MHEKEGERIDWASKISTLKALNAKRIQRQDLKMICRVHISPPSAERPLPCFNAQSESTSRQQRGRKKKRSMEKLLRSPIVVRVLDSVEIYHCCCLQRGP